MNLKPTLCLLFDKVHLSKDTYLKIHKNCISKIFRLGKVKTVDPVFSTLS